MWTIFFVHAKNEYLYVLIKRDPIVVKFIMVLYCTQEENIYSIFNLVWQNL
jgi:hypothetical protein